MGSRGSGNEKKRKGKKGGYKSNSECYVHVPTLHKECKHVLHTCTNKTFLND